MGGALVGVTGSGFNCWGIFQNHVKQKVNIYYPRSSSTKQIPTGTKFPLITFAHGYSSGGGALHSTYADRLFKPI